MGDGSKSFDGVGSDAASVNCLVGNAILGLSERFLGTSGKCRTHAHLKDAVVVQGQPEN
jgi:hypothetical protein